MQYAIVKNRILAADEYAALMAHGADIAERKIPDSEMSLKLVYGSLKPQVGHSPEEAVEETLRTLGTRYGTITGRDCIACTLVDIEFMEPITRGRAVDVPFSALIETDIEIVEKRKTSTPLFVLYKGMGPAVSLLNRPGVLCVYRQEKHPKAEVTRSCWRDAIRPERPLQCARACR